MSYILFVVIGANVYEAAMKDGPISKEDMITASDNLRASTNGCLELKNGNHIAWTTSTPIHFLFKRHKRHADFLRPCCDSDFQRVLHSFGGVRTGLM